MGRRHLPGGLVTLFLLSLGLSSPARALDLMSSTVALGGGALGVAGAVIYAGASEGDYRTREQGKKFMTAGFAISGVFTVSSTILEIAGLALTADEVERLELEVAAGGGPTVDALAAAFNVPGEVVLAAAQQARADVPALDDLPAFSSHLIGELAARAQIGPELARALVLRLYDERGEVASGLAVGHNDLAALTGVPAVELAPLVERVIDAHLAAAAQPGVVQSARHVLSRDAVQVVDQLIEAVLDAHADSVSARMEQAASEARGLVGRR